MVEIEAESQPFIDKINEDIEQRIDTQDDEERIHTIDDQLESSVESQKETIVRNSNGGSKVGKRKKNT